MDIIGTIKVVVSKSPIEIETLVLKGERLKMIRIKLGIRKYKNEIKYFLI